ncbi:MULTISPECIES: 3-keto-5-aminohexanoate cleavage protein [unclassified Corallococcus]|uniref:3-keto-5-aminohexanoate cleavage protein n=1 Tax=unclassified Corallococcus TaxID=2685029 RepID=UPI001A8EFA7F|nr:MULTISPECIES: 3-keto-5-aminohexanoate cleavage protein [unclassified Corallococcus]MBN9681271.1 3-keto-5-aminohexanoate cleavage protein [Corallococcus sp. NCSPR001]WAS87149.1 3-keto-5-aminohexanoate cleavage protein [Corallococcus sp. NCRR]
MPRMLLKVCLNGARAATDHPQLSITPEALARDATACHAAGAGAFHVHPRAAHGGESLDAADIGAAVGAIRRACPGVPVGVSTGAWMVPDVEARRARVAGWRTLSADVRPDFASVNLSEPGWESIADAQLDAGIGVEAGVWFPEDVPRLMAWPRATECLRILVETQSSRPEAACQEARTLVDLLRATGLARPLLVHGSEGGAWAVLGWARRHGFDTRIGLEDTLTLPDGQRAEDNAALVAAALQLRGG